MRLLAIFPKRAGHDPSILVSARPDYRQVREVFVDLLKARHIDELLAATYERVLVDEYQDCSILQHGIINYISSILPVCIFGDSLQAIFGFGEDPLADWNKDVCTRFPVVGELNRPWRWINAEAVEFGQWLLKVREKLLAGEAIDLNAAPEAVTWIRLNGTAFDRLRRLKAGQVDPPGGIGSVLVMGESAHPLSQQMFASQLPDAVTVEAVDLRDLVLFARDLRIDSPKALMQIAEFAQRLMTNVGAADLVRRVESISRADVRQQ